MKEAIKKEVEGLLSCGVLETVGRAEAPKEGQLLDGRFVLAMKDPKTSDERYKARFIVQGHRDEDKKYLVNASPNLMQDSVKLIFCHRCYDKIGNMEAGYIAGLSPRIN